MVLCLVMVLDALVNSHRHVGVTMAVYCETGRQGVLPGPN